MITPDDITKKAGPIYRKYLKRWVKGKAENFFPRRVPANLKLSKDDTARDIQEVNLLERKSKEQRGWGYRVHSRHVKSSVKGYNRRPESIEIETLDDLLRLARPKNPFSATREVVRSVHEELPGLSNWLVDNVQNLGKYSENIDGLIAVTKFFQENPLPNCFSRQIPVDVHTKFIEDNKTVLRQWLEILLPGSAVNVNENTFAGRFGLRDKQRHHALRLLDVQLMKELQLPFQEISIPAHSLNTLPVIRTSVIVVENQIPLLTLPTFSRTLGICGEGTAVVTLHKLKWLEKIPILYWGDLDVAGFHILSSFRNLFPQVESIMMGPEAFEAHRPLVKQLKNNSSRTLDEPTNLTEQEKAVFRECQKNNLRLEQERIPQAYVDAAFHEHFAKN